MRYTKRLCCLMAILLLFSFKASAGRWDPGFTKLPEGRWNETAVRKVLHSFAYGGFATDAQISTWADMSPEEAIKEILTFDAINPKLSPAEDISVDNATSLKDLQTLWSSDWTDNPVFPNNRSKFSLTYFNNNMGVLRLQNASLEKVWLQAVNTRGVNPFLHMMGLYLTNYHMAIHMSNTQAGLMREFYDKSLSILQSGGSIIDVLGQGAASAAVARAYGHRNNRYDNYREKFFGNDDFAREFHQLFFKIQGSSEAEAGYHEDVTIEHTAWALSGMQLDFKLNAYGSEYRNDWLSGPIDFTNHQDGIRTYVDKNGDTQFSTLYNLYNHYQSDDRRPNYVASGSCLEILRRDVCGSTAEDKILALAEVAGDHEESLENIPLALVGFFADDNIVVDPSDTSKYADRIREKVGKIQFAWKYDVDRGDVLTFLQKYATSTVFHSKDRVKFRSSFDRNITAWNLNTLSNEESFVRYESPSSYMTKEGARVFFPSHNVFGAQTGLEAATNPNVFWEAYYRTVKNNTFLGKERKNYPDGSGDIWIKDWATKIPVDINGEYVVQDVADWLWQRFIADGGDNFDLIARAQVYAMLVTGNDFGYAISREFAPDPGNQYSWDPSYPNTAQYNSSQISTTPLLEIYTGYANGFLDLNSVDPVIRKQANERIGLAINFITMMPYMFAQEGR